MQTSESLLSPPRNFFALTRTKPDCHYPPVRVDFNSTPNPRTAPLSILPVFNQDRNYFTPAFLLPSDQTYYRSNPAAERNKFAEKMRAEESQASETCIRSVEPEFEVREGDSRYCQICQLKFQDYWQHVAEQSHLRRLHLSPSTAHIRQLCDAFAQEQGSRVAQGPPEGKLQAVPKRRSKKNGQGVKGLERCLSSDLVKALQGNFSTQIMAPVSPLVEP